MQWDNGVPGPGSDVTIGSGYVLLDVDSTVNSLTLGGDFVSASPRRLTVTQGFDVGKTGYFAFSNRSAISIGGDVTNSGHVFFGFRISTSQVNADIGGVLANLYGAFVSIERNSSVTASGLVNSGLFFVEDNSTLKVNGDLWNKANPPGQGNGDFETNCEKCLSAAGDRVIVTGSIINDGLIFLNNYADFATAPRVENSAQILMPGGTLQIGSGHAPGPGYYQFPDGIFAERINMDPDKTGLIRLDHPIHLSGTLQILLQDGYNPPPGKQIPLILYGNSIFPIFGTFDKIENQYFNNGTEMWEVLKEVGGVILQAVAVQNPDPRLSPK